MLKLKPKFVNVAYDTEYHGSNAGTAKQSRTAEFLKSVSLKPSRQVGHLPTKQNFQDCIGLLSKHTYTMFQKIPLNLNLLS